jgi:hypothetical protein
MKMRIGSWVVLVGTLFVGCGGGNSSTSGPATPSTPTTTFQGTIAGSTGQSGTIDVTVQTTVAYLAPRSFSLVQTLHAQTTGTVAATGSLHLAGGATTALTGTFDSSAKTLSLSGGGFTFSGLSSAGGLSGNYTGPGNATGGFSALSSAAGAVTRYCGTYTSTAPDINSPNGTYRESGVWTLQVSSSGAATGTSTSTQTNSAAFPPGQTGSISGRVTGTTFTMNSAEGGSGTGTIQNGSVTGTTVTPSGRGSGTFTGSTGACQ